MESCNRFTAVRLWVMSTPWSFLSQWTINAGMREMSASFRCPVEGDSPGDERQLCSLKESASGPAIMFLLDSQVNIILETQSHNHWLLLFTFATESLCAKSQKSVCVCLSVCLVVVLDLPLRWINGFWSRGTSWLIIIINTNYFRISIIYQYLWFEFAFN